MYPFKSLNNLTTLLNLFLSLFFFLLLFSLSSCGRQYNTSPHIKDLDTYYINGEFIKALDIARSRTKRSKSKDRLLFLMESGSILHTMREWNKSNLAFLEADEIIEKAEKAKGRKILSFLINDSKDNFRAESFERVSVKMYIAINYLMQRKYQSARRYFKRLNQELQDIKDLEPAYRINHAARYLYAIIAEYLAEQETKENTSQKLSLNEARVQYNNLAQSKKYSEQAKANLYYIALKERDQEAIEDYRPARQHLNVFDNQMEPIPLDKLETAYTEKFNSNNNDLTEMGSLILIHESGLAPYKASRGKIRNDKIFQTFITGGIRASLATDGNTGLNFSLVLNTMKNSQNPIPIYKERIKGNAKIIPQITLNDSLVFTTDIYDDFAQMVLANYNERYSSYVSKNVASIALKVVSSLIAGKVVKLATSRNNSDVGAILGMLTSLVGGAIASSTIAPDLRAWNLNYNNLQLKRILLKPGTYQIKLNNPTSKTSFISSLPKEINIQPTTPTFLLLRSF